MFVSFDKSMDGLGVPLEPSTYAEVKVAMGKGWLPSTAGAMLPSDAGSSPSSPVNDLCLK